MREKKLTPRCFATGHVSPRSEPHLSVVRELVKFLAPESTSAVIPFERSRPAADASRAMLTTSCRKVALLTAIFAFL